MPRLTPDEDAELRWLVEKNIDAALTPNEKRRLAALRVRDRRSEVRKRGSDLPVAIPAQAGVENAADGPAYRLSRRLVDLVIASGGVQVVLLLAMHENPSYEQLVDVLPADVQPKARELLQAIGSSLG